MNFIDSNKGFHAIGNTTVLDRSTPSASGYKNVVAFVDGYNFYKAKQEAFGGRRLDTDLRALAESVCRRNKGWRLRAVRYYTGIPTEDQDARQYELWQRRIATMQQRQVNVIARGLKYRDGKLREKGVDTRIAIDMLRMAYEDKYNVALLFSQDQDFCEIVREIQSLRSNGRPVEVVCAFPSSHRRTNPRGIAGARWERIKYSDVEESRTSSVLQSPRGN